MKKTENYAMSYPEQDDYFNVEDFQNMMVSVDNLMKKLSDSGAQISSDAEHLYNQTKAQMDNIQKRMNAFTSLKDGSTTGDAELKDIRVAYDGKEYGNAGEAVREQASDIHKALFGNGVSIWSKTMSQSTKYVTAKRGIFILNEPFVADGVITKINRGTFRLNETKLGLDKVSTAYIVKFENTSGTMNVPSLENLKGVSACSIKFEEDGNAHCWIPVEKGQYLAVTSTVTAYETEDSKVPYMFWNQEQKTMEYCGFTPASSTQPAEPHSLALEYKLEYDMDDAGLVKQVAANRETAALLKEEISDSLGEFRYHGKFVSEKKYSTIDTSIVPKKGDLIFFRADENNSTLFIQANLFLYYTDNDYDSVSISKIGDYIFVVAQKDYIKTRINNTLSQADATEPTWSATVMSSGEHSLIGSLTLFYSLLDSGIELRRDDIENLKTDFISKHSKRFVVSKSKNNTYLDFTVGANDKGLIFVSETNATKFTAYDLYGHKPDDTIELLESNISVVGSIHTYDNNNRYDYLRIVFKCSSPSTSDEYVCAVVTTDTERTAFGIITRLLGDVDNLKETSSVTQEQIADLDSRMLKSEEIVLFQRNLINVNNLISGKYIDNQGNLKDNADYSVTDYEFVEPDSIYTFWRFGESYKFGQTAFYTKDKKFISYIVNVKQWKSPSNAYYVRMSMSTSHFTTGNPIVCKGTVNTDDTTYQNEYKTVVNHYVTREEIAKVNIPDMVESDTLSTLTINASNSKKNNLIGFEANFSTMGSVRIAHGTSYDSNRSASIVVDATNIYLYDKSTNLRATYPHGLTMSKFITVSIVVGQMRTAKIILTTANGRFIQDSVFWGGCREDVTAQAISGTFTNARLTWYVPDYNHDLWAFGDSYFDFWVADVIQNLGYHNFMSDGFGGRRSTGAFISLELALAKAMPKKILWCLGMNDPDTEDAINAEWKVTLDNLINLCDEKGIELILCTIPNTPVTVHKYKNAYVKSSGKRYVDVCHAVGADVSPEWYDGMRTNTETDKIHPTNPLGTRTIADYMLENVPELAN